MALAPIGATATLPSGPEGQHGPTPIDGGFTMTALRGGAIDEMHQMAKTWSAQAGQLRQLTNSLNSTTANSNAIWTGPGGDKFRAEWQQCRAAFEKMATTLDDGSAAITKYADNIQAATA
jgi:WXG100 family type VII secretion target